MRYLTIVCLCFISIVGYSQVQIPLSDLKSFVKAGIPTIDKKLTLMDWKFIEGREATNAIKASATWYHGYEFVNDSSFYFNGMLEIIHSKGDPNTVVYEMGVSRVSDYILLIEKSGAKIKSTDIKDNTLRYIYSDLTYTFEVFKSKVQGAMFVYLTKDH